MKILFFKTILLLGTLALFGCAAKGGGPSIATPALTSAKLAGSNATPQMMNSVRGILRLWYYKGCTKIDILQLVSLSPEDMRGKEPLVAGDKWTEKWKVDACGTIAVHPVEFELIAVGGQISPSMDVKPAE